MPHNSNFWLPRGYGNGAKSRWGPPRVHLGVNGVPLGKRNGSKPQKMTMPEIRIFGQRFFANNLIYGFGAKSRWGPLGSILGPMGSHWVKHLVKTVKNYHAQKFEIKATPRSSWGQWGPIG